MSTVRGRRIGTAGELSEVSGAEAGTQPVGAYDFARSYLRFRSDRVNHTPRLQLDAACTLRVGGGKTRRFVLTCPCIGENMYVASGLVQEPPFEFVMIAEHRVEFAAIKTYAAAERDVREAHRFGEAMATHSGVPATVTALDVSLATSPEAHPITTYESFRDALLADRPIAGRTTFLAEDGATTVVLEYPAKVVNVAHGRPVWQVDTGPVLVPDLRTPLAVGELLAGRFELAFLLFNTWDRVEVVRRCRVELGRPGQDSISTAHYGEVRVLAARNELFCTGAEPANS